MKESPEAWWVHCTERHGANRIDRSKSNRERDGEKRTGQKPRSASRLFPRHGQLPAIIPKGFLKGVLLGVFCQCYFVSL